MKKRAGNFLMAAILIIAVLLSAAGCSYFLGPDSILVSGDQDTAISGQDSRDDLNDQDQDDGDPDNMGTGDSRPKAVMEIYQENSDGIYFNIGSPVYFSASSSYDGGGGHLSFYWNIKNGEDLSGMEASYIFTSPGEYEVTLTVRSEMETDSISMKIKLIEQNDYILVTDGYDMTVGIEYIFKNNGPGDILELVTMIEIPKTYKPFQLVKGRRSNYKGTDEVFSDEHNLIASFNFGNLPEGESAYAYVNIDLTLYEYDYRDPGSGSGTLENIEKEYSQYTEGEYYINSGSQKIRTAVESIIGSEKDPAVIAEALYDFVVDKLIYDEERINSGAFGYSYASDILQKEKGVCTDYSILYAALCRAAGIPAQFVQGIPVQTILGESDNKLPYAHAWVEIFLPGLGWIPIDITSEEGFMAHNYYLNLQTYKGSGIFYKSLEIDGEDYYPTGYYYSWDGDTEPDISSEVVYSVSGLEAEETNVIASSEFLDEVRQVISEYGAAVNHINQAHDDNWIFNDPGEIMIEETFVGKAKELSSILANIPYPDGFTAERNNMVKLSQDISFYKEEQIKCMKAGDYECSINNYNNFADALDALFDGYNDMATKFNQKY